MFYSPSKNSFYTIEIHSVMPVDVMEITQQTHANLMAEQATGKCIKADENGAPVAVAPNATPAAIPSSLSMKQARLALLAAGHLDAVESGVSAMPRASQIAWEFAATVDRTDPLTATLAAALGLNAAALDALFTAGAAL